MCIIRKYGGRKGCGGFGGEQARPTKLYVWKDADLRKTGENRIWGREQEL